ncbi:MerR family transcriptional regulator [Rummeliibacillus pycnus]|uniref:MerR family transcriptional regulator n=1 Tax=Rummeliibacillus pycnus TaxID=101070 RepID=UPI000C9BD4E9|nr:MerR family transcriptional regulator [Rummeliibacillus pycnus]
MTSYIRGKQLRDLISLSESNLKRYYELLEQHGYVFARNSRGHRIYSEDDIKVFQAVIYLNKGKNMSLDDAASFVCSKGIDIDAIFTDTKNDSQNDQNLTSYTVMPSEVRSEQTVKMLVEIHEMQVAHQSYFEQLKKENKELQHQLLRFETQIDERDQLIDQILEKVNQQAATIESKMDNHYRQLKQKQFEQFEKIKQKEKKGFFNRLFKN